MIFAKRHPMMQSLLRAESGIFGTYTLVVVAVVCSIVSAALFLDPTVSSESAVVSAFTSDEGPVWVDATPPRAPGTEQSASGNAATPPIAAPDSELGINGLDLPPDEPAADELVYDEAAALAVYMW